VHVTAIRLSSLTRKRRHQHDPISRTQLTHSLALIFLPAHYDSFVIYTAVLVPFSIAFHWWESQGYLTFSYVLDAWFIVDMILSLSTGNIEHGEVVMDRRKVWKHYCHTW
jgi:hypothetical protein